MAEDQPKLVDAAGRAHVPAAESPRILSLAPALTELCFALELGEYLVGRSDLCRKPEQKLASVPAVGSPAAIRLDKIERLAPTHALVNIDDTPKTLIEAIEEAGITVVAIRLERAEDNFRLYTLLGQMFAAEAEADALARRFEAALARVKMAVRRKSVRRVLYLVDKNPYRTAGAQSYAANLLSLVKLQAVSEEAETAPSLAPSGRRYPVIDLTESLLLSVDAVLLSGAPGAFRRSDLEAFSEGHGVAREQLIRLEDAIDGWYGARAPAALEDLVALRERIESLG